jgi:riboflavin synthase
MFTGIILDIGTVAGLEAHGNDLRAAIEVNSLALETLQPGDSIAVNGVCLTAVALKPKVFYVDVSAETLSCTTLGHLAQGSRVNLETALTPSTALGGHLVSGHVDGVGHIVDCEDDGRSRRYRIESPPELARYIAAKGSIAIDGVSITVNAVERNCFSINIIPHTMEKTIFADYRTGSAVNLEVDIIARYLERLVSTSDS